MRKQFFLKKIGLEEERKIQRQSRTQLLFENLPLSSKGKQKVKQVYAYLYTERNRKKTNNEIMKKFWPVKEVSNLLPKK